MIRKAPFESWLARLDRRPPAFPATVAALGGFGISAALLGSESIPKALGFGAVAALGAAAGWLAQTGQPILEVEAPPPAEPYPRPHPITPRELWVDLSGGTFLMGSPPEEEDRFDQEGPQHEVTLSPFQMMRVPVTRALYQQVTGQDPGWPDKGEDLAERPANNVSWYDALHFCNLLSQREGLRPAYGAKGSRGPFAEGSAITWDRGADGYCLPTEAQWEYACRAGSATLFCFGDADKELGDYAWYADNSPGEPQPVGRKKANALGLFDLHGNVWEWCWDTFAAYGAGVRLDPAGPQDRSVLLPVVRGGSCGNGSGRLRSAFRDGFEPVFWFRFLGFRCVRVSRPVFGSSPS
jgi:formylglycine-generating enzyme required for sulfatase activity